MASTATSSAGSTTKSKKANGKGGKGGGRGRGGGSEKFRLDKTAEVPARLTKIENVLCLVMRMVCLHDNEHRRVAKENNDVIEFEKMSTMPAKLKESQAVWRGEIREATEDDPYPSHPEWAWRHAAFHRMAETLLQSVVEYPNPEEAVQKKLEDAGKLLSNKSLASQGVLRFYMITDESEENEEALQRWVIRFDKSHHGTRMRAALALLDAADVLAKGLKGVFRRDRAPKGGMIRTIEGILEAYLGKRERKAR